MIILTEAFIGWTIVITIIYALGLAFAVGEDDVQKRLVGGAIVVFSGIMWTLNLAIQFLNTINSLT